MQNIVIIGLGSQGLAWAQNLRDSGRQVNIALREGAENSKKRCHSLGFETHLLKKNQWTEPQNFILLIPDHEHLNFFKSFRGILPNGSKVIYAHGFSMDRYKWNELYPELEHLLLAPKAIAAEVRKQYQVQGKLGAVQSTEAAFNTQIAKNWLESLAKDLGITHLYEASFKQETVADLFSEQTLLCSLLPYGALKSFEKLRKAGIPPELAYMECWVEMKLIVDTMVNLGPLEFFKLISPNALLGGEKAQEVLLGESYDKQLDRLLDDIQTGKFANECDKSDFKAVQKSVIERWEASELSKVHHSLNLT